MTDPPADRRSYRVRFPGGHGYQLAGIVDRPEGLKRGPVAVFSHCFTCNKDLKAIVRISRALADQGITVLRFDMTGLGGSEGDFSHTDFSSNLSDLAAAIDFAEDELGEVSALIGHSFGGAAALAIAGETGVINGKHLQSVVTLAAPSDTTHLAALLVRMNRAIEREGAGEVTIGGRPWLIRQEILADLRAFDLPARITNVRLPTLIFHSPQDATVGFDHAIRIQSLIQSGRGEIPASLVALPGADHLLVKPAHVLTFVAQTTAAFVWHHHAR